MTNNITSIPPSTPLGPFVQLPAELMGRVLSFLDPSSVRAFARTSRSIHSLAIGVVNGLQSDGLKNYITNLCLSLSEDSYAEIRDGLEFTKTVISSEMTNFQSSTKHIIEIQKNIFNVLSKLDVVPKRAVLEDVSIPNFCKHILQLKGIVQGEEMALSCRDQLPGDLPNYLRKQYSSFDLFAATFVDFVRVGEVSAALRMVQDLDILVDIDGMGYIIRDEILKAAIREIEDLEIRLDPHKYLQITNPLPTASGERNRALVSICKTLCGEENIDIAQVMQLANTIPDMDDRGSALSDLCIKIIERDEGNVSLVLDIILPIKDPRVFRQILISTFQHLMQKRDADLFQILKTAYTIQNNIHRDVAHEAICHQLLRQQGVDLDLVFDTMNLIDHAMTRFHIMRILIPRLITEEKKSPIQILESLDRFEGLEADKLRGILCKALLKKAPLDYDQLSQIAYTIQDRFIFADIFQQINQLFAAPTKPQTRALNAAPVLNAAPFVIQLVGKRAVDLAMKTATSTDDIYLSLVGNLASQGDVFKALEVARYIENREKRERIMGQLL